VVDVHTEPWRDLFVMLGTSSAALLGLLYVVASLHLDEITKNPIYRARTRSNALYLIITIVIAAFILTPQPVFYLGLELAAANLVGAAINIRNTYKFTLNPDFRRRGGFSFVRVANFLGAFGLGTVAGVCLMKGLVAGLYIAMLSYVALLVGVSLNTWSIMLGIGRPDATKSAARKKRA
jgi:hypothetical protein